VMEGLRAKMKGKRESGLDMAENRRLLDHLRIFDSTVVF
jgi:hypothetical protein